MHLVAGHTEGVTLQSAEGLTVESQHDRGHSRVKQRRMPIRVHSPSEPHLRLVLLQYPPTNATSMGLNIKFQTHVF